jgi:hypothetical protein
MAQLSLLFQGFFTIEALRPHSIRHITLGYDFRGREIDPTQRPLVNDTTHKRQVSMSRTHILSKRAATDTLLRPRAAWDSHLMFLCP